MFPFFLQSDNRELRGHFLYKKQIFFKKTIAKNWVHLL